MCGLYGFVNNGKRPFRYDIFTVLGIANDRRGGDSCGVFIDGQVEYGIGQEALFENFFWNSKLLNNTKECTIALGHDRKASVGGITVEKAHPIIIKNDAGNVDFVLIHNGTIHNYEELAKQYIPDINITKCSDSQVLALILYHKGFDVLSKYNGGTAFVAVDYRKGYPETYLFKGASKNTLGEKEPSVERPLYFAFNKERLVFSSIPSYLCALVPDNVYESKNNKVYKYVNGTLYDVKTIDRSKCQQNKIYNYYPTTSAYSSNYGIEYRYIKYIDNANIYSDEDGKLLHGKYKISEYGRIVKSSEKIGITALKLYNVFFFNGIPLRDKYTFNVISKNYKKSGIADLDIYTERNLTAIRYHSIDPVFMDNNFYFKAVSETSYVPFTGTLQVLGRSSGKKIKDGHYESYAYNLSTDDYFKSVLLS